MHSPNGKNIGSGVDMRLLILFFFFVGGCTNADFATIYKCEHNILYVKSSGAWIQEKLYETNKCLPLEENEKMRLTNVRNETTEGLMDEWEKLYVTKVWGSKDKAGKDSRLREIIEELKRRVQASLKSTP